MISQCIIRIHHVKLRVRDLERSTEFYTGLFGFQRRPRLAGPLIQECTIRQEDGGEFGIVLSQWSQQEVTPHTLDHISLEVPGYEDVFDLYRRARQLEAQATAPRFYERHWQTFIFDPDGHKIEILTRDPGPSCENEVTAMRPVGTIATI